MHITITATYGSWTGKTHTCVNETASDLWAAWYAGRGTTTTRTLPFAATAIYDAVKATAELVARLWALGVRALRKLVAGRFNYKPCRKADLVARLTVLGVG